MSLLFVCPWATLPAETLRGLWGTPIPIINWHHPEWLWKHILWGRPVTPDLGFLICEMGTVTVPTSQGYCEIKQDKECLLKKMCVCLKNVVFSPSSYRHNDWAPFKKAMLGTRWTLKSREERKQREMGGWRGENANSHFVKNNTQCSAL